MYFMVLPSRKNLFKKFTKHGVTPQKTYNYNIYRTKSTY